MAAGPSISDSLQEQRPPITAGSELPVVLPGISPSFDGLSRSQGQVTHVLLTRTPVYSPGCQLEIGQLLTLDRNWSMLLSFVNIHVLAKKRACDQKLSEGTVNIGGAHYNLAGNRQNLGHGIELLFHGSGCDKDQHIGSGLPIIVRNTVLRAAFAQKLGKFHIQRQCNNIVQTTTIRHYDRYAYLC